MLVLTRWFRRALVSGVCVAGLLGGGVVPALADPGDPPDPGVEQPAPAAPAVAVGVAAATPAAGTRCAAACGGSAGAGSRADHPAAGGAPDR